MLGLAVTGFAVDNLAVEGFDEVGFFVVEAELLGLSVEVGACVGNLVLGFVVVGVLVGTLLGFAVGGSVHMLALTSSQRE